MRWTLFTTNRVFGSSPPGTSRPRRIWPTVTPAPGAALVRPWLCLAPGLLNATAALNTAYAASSPVMMISGQIERDFIGVNRGMLHEVDDQLDIMKTVTKFARRAMDPAEVPDTVHEAFQHLKNGRPRPVEIEIPPETLAEVADIELFEPEAPRPQAPDAGRIAEAARMLAAADNPLIWAGGGTISSERLGRSAETGRTPMQMPVIATAEGKGVIISDRHPLSLGSLWLRNDTVAGENSSHDLVLAVGTRLAFPMWLGGQQVIQIDVDDEELGRNYDNTFGVQGDARVSLEALLAEVSKLTPARNDRSAEVAAERSQREEARIVVEPQESLLAAVRSAMPDDGILIAGMTQLGLLQPGVLPSVRTPDLHHLILLREPGLRLPHGPGSEGGATRQGGGGAFGGRRFSVQLAGDGDSSAVRNQRGGGDFQRQRLRQRSTRPAQSIHRTYYRRGAAQSRLYEAGRCLRHERRPRRDARGPGDRPAPVHFTRRAVPDRGASWTDANTFRATGVARNHSGDR